MFCEAPLRHTFVDLGMSPLCESYVPLEKLNHIEPFYPLHVYVCERCFLVQLEEYVSPAEIFSEYAYFSSYAESWVEHMRRYVDMISERLRLGRDSFVVEVASNDGYLLQHFVKKGIPVLGIEPAANVAKVAVEKGIPTLVKFFGERTARELAEENLRNQKARYDVGLATTKDLLDFQDRLTAAGYGRITTEVADAPPFYYAEDYHQQYLAKNPGGYCGHGGTGVACPIGIKV